MQPEPPATELITVFTRMQGVLPSQEHAAVAVHQLAQVARNLMTAGVRVSRIDARVTGTGTGATDHLVEAVDALQYDLGDGPCPRTWATTAPQRINDTTDEDRWPTWCVAAARTSDAAQRLGIALRAGLEDGQAIDRATGMLMEQRATGPDQAHAVLPAASRVQGPLMVEIARQVLERRPDPHG